MAIARLDGRYGASGDGRHYTCPPYWRCRHLLPRPARLAATGTKLYVAGIGQNSLPPDYADVRAKNISAPANVSLRNRAVVRAVLESRLPSPRSVPVKVLLDGKERETRRLDLPAGRHVAHFETIRPVGKEGVHRLTITCDLPAGDAGPENNSRSTFIRAHRSKALARYVEGRPRWEYRFARGVLREISGIGFEAILAPFAPRPDTAVGGGPLRPAGWEMLTGHAGGADEPGTPGPPGDGNARGAAAGGAFFDPANADTAFRAVASRGRAFVREHMETYDLLHPLWMLGPFVSLLMAEWLLRERMGLP
ncbi:MAG: hypothetical protein N3A38_11120 [Planctomycetota bacterium]|nr:hypothetical protein [Planctomycetota bacterium]